MSFIVSQLDSLQIAVQDNELKICVHEYNINKAAPCIATHNEWSEHKDDLLRLLHSERAVSEGLRDEIRP